MLIRGFIVGTDCKSALSGQRYSIQDYNKLFDIAKMVEVPIVMVAFDYGKKEHRISEPFYSTEYENLDFEQMHRFFEKAVGKRDKKQETRIFL